MKQFVLIVIPIRALSADRERMIAALLHELSGNDAYSVGHTTWFLWSARPCENLATKVVPLLEPGGHVVIAEVAPDSAPIVVRAA